MIAMASAADVTFKDVVREACLSRDHFMAWTDDAGSAEAAAAQVSAALGVDRRRQHRGRRARDRRRAESAAIALGGDRRVLDTGSKTDQNQADRLREALAFTGATQVDEYLGVFLTDERAPRKTVLTKKFGDNNPAIARAVRPGKPAHRSPDRAAPRA